MTLELCHICAAEIDTDDPESAAEVEHPTDDDQWVFVCVRHGYEAGARLIIDDDGDVLVDE